MGSWTAIVAVAAFIAAFVLLPRPEAVPREPGEGTEAEDCIVECAPV